MSKLISLLLVLCFASTLNAQYKVRIVVEEATAIKHDSVYIAGTFNKWDSNANANYRFRNTGIGEHSIVLNLPAGVHRYKLTRGNWLTVEKQPNGDEIPDHIINISKDTAIRMIVQSWRDEILKDKRYALSLNLTDSVRISLYTNMAFIFAFYPEWYNTDSALHYAGKALSSLQSFKASKDDEYSSQNDYLIPFIENQEITASLLHTLGNYTKSLELRLDNLRLAESIKNKFLILTTYRGIIADYTSMKDYKKVLYYARKMLPVIQTISFPEQINTMFLMVSNFAMAESYYNLSMLDSSLAYATKNYRSDSSWPYRINSAYVNNILGDIYTKKTEYIKALSHYRASLVYSLPAGSFHVASLSYKGISMLFQKNGNIDSSLFYAKLAMRTLQENLIDVKSWGENVNGYLVEITPLIAALYKAKNKPDSAYKYLQLSVDLRDTLYNTERIRQFQTLSFNESVKEQQQLQREQEMRQLYKTRIKIYGLIAGLIIVLIIALLLYRNNTQKQKVNLSLEQQKIKVEKTLEELKRTQAQLIQSEKMASLGELTAGIAHEIQNPLNFVNNFSEVNTELVEEMEEEIEKGNLDDVKTLAKAIKENEEKINHHGKRADAIVKGMLHHSRTSDGQKELTDINALTDEYLRLAYHGLRAKDKSFNALIETDFDLRISKINIIPQDIGRAILNLITNAFYAVNEKKKHEGENYEPTVLVSTKKLKDGVEISIKDNGNGIPQKVIDKIFQPFFTTKPTGQGTGLGLSLSYDIVKAHGGELRVETKDGEGATFIVEIPFNK